MTTQRLPEDFAKLPISERRRILDELRALHAEMKRQAARTEIETATAFVLTTNQN